jgi:hypothetical protein
MPHHICYITTPLSKDHINNLLVINNFVPLHSLHIGSLQSHFPECCLFSLRLFYFDFDDLSLNDLRLLPYPDADRLTESLREGFGFA